MRSTRSIPLAIAALALAVACNNNEDRSARIPTDPIVPHFAVHFVGGRSCTQVGSNLLCNFKVAGLGNISTATVTVQAPFSCTKTTNGEQFVQPGGLASATQQNVPVSNGQITVTDFVVQGGRCPDQFSPTFSGNATLIINGVVVGTIPIT
jgi:hypothetical protein